jgi:hypothetical protein
VLIDDPDLKVAYEGLLLVERLGKPFQPSCPFEMFEMFEQRHKTISDQAKRDGSPT